MDITLSSIDTQAALIRSVYNSAALDPTDTKFIEAHKTETTIGDSLEAAAFVATIGQKPSPDSSIFIESGKLNFGYLKGVSGISIVSIIKSAMMLENQVNLSHANFETPNPKTSSLG